LLSFTGSHGIQGVDDSTDFTLRMFAIAPLNLKESMALAQPGLLAPDFTLATLDGQSLTLSHGRGWPHLLVFLRHLG
jgi:hypothetical protein